MTATDVGGFSRHAERPRLRKQQAHHAHPEWPSIFLGRKTPDGLTVAQGARERFVLNGLAST